MWQGLFSLGSKTFYTRRKQRLKMIWYRSEALWTSLTLNSIGNSLFHWLQRSRALNVIVDRCQTNNTLIFSNGLSQPAVQAFGGRAKAACLCSYRCNRHLCYVGGRLGRVKIVTLRVAVRAKEGRRGGRYPSYQKRLGTECDSARPGKKWQKSPRSTTKSPW